MGSGWRYANTKSKILFCPLSSIGGIYRQMQELDDNSLLREYAEKHSEEAFAALVTRHINKVYSVALRHTHNPGEAEEITQAVFVILARKAHRLGKKVVVSGWLYQTARLASVTYLRSEIRRARREQEAHTMQTILNEPDETWTEIAPLLDAAMARLNATDRHAVVLRYFDGKSMREVGEALGATEDAVKKRLGRALEKLQRFFAKRGALSTTAIIAGSISSNSVQAAPPALANSVTAAAIAKGAAAGASALTLVHGVLKAMTLQKIKIPAIAAAFLILATGTTALGVEHVHEQLSHLPYRVVDDFWRLFNSMDTNRLEVAVTVSSTDKSVRPEDICFTIHSAIKGPILVRASTNGLVSDFPDDPVLRKENPDITVNQPAQSLHPVIWCWMPAPEGLTFDYRRLGDGVAEARNGITKINDIMTPGNVGLMNYAEWLFTPGFKIKGVILYFQPEKTKRESIQIMAREGVQTYWADRSGVLRLKLDKTLLQENPEVKVSEKLAGICPDFFQSYW